MIWQHIAHIMFFLHGNIVFVFEGRSKLMSSIVRKCSFSMNLDISNIKYKSVKLIKITSHWIEHWIYSDEWWLMISQNRCLILLRMKAKKVLFHFCILPKDRNKNPSSNRKHGSAEIFDFCHWDNSIKICLNPDQHKVTNTYGIVKTLISYSYLDMGKYLL